LKHDCPDRSVSEVDAILSTGNEAGSNPVTVLRL
jgi:hypothetical protein